MDERLKTFSKKIAEKIQNAHINKLPEITIKFPFINNENTEQYMYYQTAYYNLVGQIAVEYTKKYNKKKEILAINAFNINEGIRLYFQYK